MRGRAFAREEAGAAMVEMTIVVTLMFTLLLGFVDFGYAFYQWNAANKAVQIGARLAAVSDAVPVGLSLEGGTPASTADIGVAVPANTYHYRCTATAAGVASCSCVAGTCADLTVDEAGQDAFDLILDGDAAGDVRRPGMRDFFPGLAPDQIRIEYVASGLGYWTRPGGAVPTIRVSIVNRSFDFFFLSGLLSFTPISMPDMLSTVTGEDLSTTY
jgi:hypothetical protein